MAKDPSGAFKTHANYLRAFDMLALFPFFLNQTDFYEDLYTKITQSGVLSSDKRRDVDYSRLEKSLNNAWGTEFLLLSSANIIKEEELLRLSNNWSCIQTYYVFYHSTQALAMAKGHKRPESHPKTQRLFCEFWAKRKICLPPWSFAYGSQGFRNVPMDVTIYSSMHTWSSCDKTSAWSLAGKSLKTTRKESLKEKQKQEREIKQKKRRKKWQEQEAKRLTQGKRPRKEPSFSLPVLTDDEKKQLDHKLRPYTVMDYLYRLRIKTNYVDSNMFTDARRKL